MVEEKEERKHGGLADDDTPQEAEQPAAPAPTQQLPDRRVSDASDSMKEAAEATGNHLSFLETQCVCGCGMLVPM